MARYHRKRPDEPTADITPEKHFLSRRRFVQGTAVALGGAGIAAAGFRLARARADTRALRETLRPPANSAFRAGERNPRYAVATPMTAELEAARYNNFYEFGLDKDRCWREAQELHTRPWTIEVRGLVETPRTYDIDDLIRTLPCEERVYRFRCVERWAMVVPWSGFAFSELMRLVRPLSAAKYVRFESMKRPEEAVGQRTLTQYAWPYYEGLTLREAANELCFLATGVYGHDLPRQHGAPARLVVPWKYGYKGAKSIVRIDFTDQRPSTFWNDLQPDEYGFYSNVDPAKPHPRWSQQVETLLGSNTRRRTELYNGYADLVSPLYDGSER